MVVVVVAAVVAVYIAAYIGFVETDIVLRNGRIYRRRNIARSISVVVVVLLVVNGTHSHSDLSCHSYIIRRWLYCTFPCVRPFGKAFYYLLVFDNRIRMACSRWGLYN